MLSDNFNKDFTKVFTRDCPLYSATEEYRHGNFLFMQFAGDAREMKATAISVSKRMYLSPFISRIVQELEKKSIPQITSLYDTATNLINEFNAYIQCEPYICHYCHELIHTLRSFQELTNALNAEVCGQTTNKLKDLQAGMYDPGCHIDIDSFYLYPVIEKIEFFLKNLLTYYYHFLILKEQENESGKGIGLTTHVADYLFELIGAIEIVSNNIEDVLDMLLTWEVSMDLCEEQALYN